MKVKISYTIDMENVPSEVNHFLAEVGNKLKTTSSKQIIVQDDNVVQALKDIESLRSILLDVDTRLNDCYGILAGYNKAVAESMLAKETESNNEPNVLAES